MWILIGGVVLIVIAVGLWKLVSGRARASKHALYEKAPQLFSSDERSFHEILEQAIGDNYRIFAKVRLADLVRPRKDMDHASYRIAVRRLNRKRVDYVICGISDFIAVGAIRLDDKSHRRRDRRRDRLIDQALTDAAIPVLHFSARMSHSVPEVRSKIAETFSLRLKEEPGGDTRGRSSQPTEEPNEFFFDLAKDMPPMVETPPSAKVRIMNGKRTCGRPMP